MERHVVARHVSDQHLLAESLGLLAPAAREIVAAFYERLFAEQPRLRPMFAADLDGQHDALLRAVTAIVTHYDRPERLVPALTAMGRQHEESGVRIDHYSLVGMTLVATLRRFAGPDWNDEFEGAWLRAYTFIAGVMMQAGAMAAATTGLSRLPERVAA
jgi:hemoglobin-like flavoprotein